MKSTKTTGAQRRKFEFQVGVVDPLCYVEFRERVVLNWLVPISRDLVRIQPTLGANQREVPADSRVVESMGSVEDGSV